jgi:predicted  nucleic acid-binding Zn-ribbon protein
MLNYCECGAAYAVGLEGCPQCGGTVYTTVPPDERQAPVPEVVKIPAAPAAATSKKATGE